ncbi:hypothetical protein G7Y89_g15067 [Cudoniella acicularis]|uniref:Heterokaryon incompatibility domain-containing protein n=1 Tax=Cudoniella acicularis TaxID=354080 RepID=A0A8H4VPC9_9HELO|nr:hypothetical protein G7Y89_g15067 [Cudoniella acicularis]
MATKISDVQHDQAGSQRDTSSPKPLTFSDLPTEIREQIWNLSFEPRILCLHAHEHHISVSPTADNWDPPSLAAMSFTCSVASATSSHPAMSPVQVFKDYTAQCGHRRNGLSQPGHLPSSPIPLGPPQLYICHESRELAKKKYTLFFPGIDFGLRLNPSIHTEWKEKSLSLPKVWVDFSIDSIFIDAGQSPYLNQYNPTLKVIRKEYPREAAQIRRLGIVGRIKEIAMLVKGGWVPHDCTGTDRFPYEFPSRPEYWVGMEGLEELVLVDGEWDVEDGRWSKAFENFETTQIEVPGGYCETYLDSKEVIYRSGYRGEYAKYAVGIPEVKIFWENGWVSWNDEVGLQGVASEGKGMSKPESLCRYCEKIPFDPVQLDSLLEIRTFNLGPITRVRSSRCPFCRLVILSVHEVIRTSQQTSISNLLPDDKPVLVKWMPAIGPGSGAFSTSGSDTWISFIRPTTDQPPSHPAYCLRQNTSPQVNITQISQWLSTCYSTHGKCNKISPAVIQDFFPGLTVLRLIDTQRKCIVERRENCKYIALSYVWGSAPNVRLTKTNRLQFEQPGSLDRHSYLLPRTIRDAMSLVPQLGLRYLWVDALCLVQNDPGDLKSGINVMDLIYEWAWLTIVAASGHDANAGLPGLAEGTRHIHNLNVEIRPGVSLGIYTQLDQLLKPTAYRSRAWTFQEHFLSPRALYFVDDKIFFRCYQADYGEGCFEKSRFAHSMSSLLPMAVELQEPIQDFEVLLKYYSASALTNQNDILRAMAGIIRKLSKKLGYRFFEGIPVGAFDFFVMFSCAQHQPLRRRSGFPSYSWTGWIGTVDLPSIRDLVHWLKAKTWIQWFKRSHSGILNLVWDPMAYDSLPRAEFGFERYTTRVSFNPPSSLRFSTVRTAPTEDLGFEVAISVYPLLQFWTLSVFYTISEINVFSGDASLVDKSGRQCGRISLDNFESSTYFELPGPFECILLSESNETFNSYPRVKLGGEWQCYNVILLEWTGNIAERRGIGVIAKLAIVNSFHPGPVWKEIFLA